MPRTGVCEPLMPGVMAPKVHKNNRSYICELSGPTFRFTMQEFSMVGGYTRRTLKNHKSIKIGGWALGWDNTVLNPAFPVRGHHLSLLQSDSTCCDVSRWYS